MIFCCPVCGGELTRRGGSLYCPAGHCHDLSKYGYVNLLLSNRSSAKRHGDDLTMLRARRAFLEAGYYAPVRDALLRLALPVLAPGSRVLDAGCGEGWYTAALAAAAEEKRIRLALLDISKDALRLAADRLPGAELAVASSARLPVPDGGCELLLNLFSPLEAKEFRRVLSPGGTLIRAVVLPGHLLELKEAVYERPYDNPEPQTELEGFVLTGREDVREIISLHGEDIRRLFTMTPYYYKTSAEDFARLEGMESLSTTLAVALLRCQKI